MSAAPDPTPAPAVDMALDGRVAAVRPRPGAAGRAARVRAPELVGRGGWVGTGGRDLRLADLRGRFVLLDFWTSGCLNCIHVLDELRPVEARWADELVVVGVHSPKFAHEADHAALVAAVERADVGHPVLDDPDLTTWQAYAVKAWPTLALVDPEGYVVAQWSGEGHGHAIDALLAELVPAAAAAGALQRGEGPYVPPVATPGDLHFPGGLVALPDGTWLVADTAHHRLVVLHPDAATVHRTIGTGERGLVDGPADVARFSEPQGVGLLPPEVATAVGYDVLVADTVNHALRGVRLDTGAVTTVAGTGAAWMQGDPLPPYDRSTAAGTAAATAATPLSSPWAVAWHAPVGGAVVAMAGIHQLWAFDPVAGRVGVLAGTTNEGLVDGPALEAWLAQPSGLAPAGDRLWFVDAETSALRRLERGEVGTAVGTGLFDFGFRDGPADRARLQHPLGVAVLPDGSVAVADTYNGAVRRFDPRSGAVSTMAAGLAEPSALAVDGEHLLVAESAAHRLVRVPLAAAVAAVDDGEQRTQRPVTPVAPGRVELVVRFAPPPGQHLDDRFGPATRLVVGATPPALLREGAGRGTDLARTLVLDSAVGDGVLHVAAMAASCDDGAENPDGDAPATEERVSGACHVHQQDWGVPVRLDPAAPARLELVLGGA